jgi:hypothetical protein
VIYIYREGEYDCNSGSVHGDYREAEKDKENDRE